MHACRVGDVPLVSELLRRRANVNSTNTKGKSTLHEAAKHQRSAVVKLLLQAGADFEIGTNWKKSQMRPLHYAARSGDLESASLLLAAGADPAAATNDGETAAVLAQGHAATQKMLYQALHATVRQRGEAFPSAALVTAAGRGEVERLRALLDAGADADSTDGTLSALQRACAERQVEAVAVLLAAGASVSLVAPGRTSNSMTALHYAARAGPQRLVVLLLGSAADPAQGGTDGTLPLDRVSFLTRDMVAVQRLLRTRLREHTILEGWLVKLGSERKKWRRRYCVLLHDQLRYYSDEVRRQF